MSYTIHKLAQLAGVSTRTLRYYDQIGLLKPSGVQKNGYRVYSQESLLRLQQILFFRELEFSLEDIQRIMNNPQFDQIAALKDQRHLLELRKKRLEGLVKTITKTIKHMTNKTMPSDRELYDAFADEEVKQYAEEAKERWGNTEAYKQSQERIKQWTKADAERIKEEGNALTKKIADMMSKGPTDKDVQVLIAEHYKGINVFYDCSLEMYKNLGQMYVEDSRFTAYYEKFAPGLALFMQQAIHYFCQAHKTL